MTALRIGKRPKDLVLTAIVSLCAFVPVVLAAPGVLSGPKAFAATPTLDAPYSHPVLDAAMLTSGFGQRIDPFTAKPRWHDGVDLVQRRGAPIYAPAEGEVVFAGVRRGYGNTIELAVSDSKRLRFAHMLNMSVKAGDRVLPGEVIGTVGNTGRTSTNHVHLEVLVNDVQYDPENEDGLIFATELRRRGEERVIVEVSRPGTVDVLENIAISEAAHSETVAVHTGLTE
jgi:murein DD-endopeptidase MepM/ murein hydrolase activator NlpD